MTAFTFDQFDQFVSLGDQLGWQRTGTPEERDRLRLAILKRLKQSTVLKQYIRHLGTPSPRNRFGWHAEGERQYAQFLLAMVDQPGGPLLSSTGGERLDEVMGIGLALNLALAQVYLWSDAIEALADATPMPSHVISRDILPYPMMFWSRETAHVGEDWQTNWLVIMSTIHGIRTIADIQRGRDDVQILIGDIPYGQKFPEDFGEHSAGVGAILGRLSFLASPYVSATTERVPRAWRREAERAGVPKTTADPLIRVVQLRREAQERVDQEREDRAQAAAGRKSHWWVSGHHRAQWYPSKEAHEVIWIAPYLKGDLSKPLAQKVYRVAR